MLTGRCKEQPLEIINALKQNQSANINTDMYITGLTYVIAILLIYLLWNEALCMQIYIYSFLLTCKVFVTVAERNSQIVAEYEKVINDYGIM